MVIAAAHVIEKRRCVGPVVADGAFDKRRRKFLRHWCAGKLIVKSVLAVLTVARKAKPFVEVSTFRDCAMSGR